MSGFKRRIVNFIRRWLSHKKKQPSEAQSPYHIFTKPFPSGDTISIGSSVNGQTFTTVKVEGAAAGQLVADFREAALLDGRVKTLMQQKHFEQAAECITAVLEIDRRIGEESRIAADYGNLGNALMALNRFDEAESFIKKGLHLDECANRKVSVGIHRYNLGRIFLKRKNRSAAIKEIEQSLDILKGTEAEATVRKLLLHAQSQ